MTREDLAYLPAARAAALLRRREISPVELVDVYLERIATLDGKLRAYITICGDTAREAARQAERELATGADVGPLHGLPIAAKDQFYTRGVRTTAGSRILEGFVPDEDATVIARLRAAGAILLGKLNLSEFALGGTLVHPYGQPRNPWALDREPGGSSSGSGIAAAAALCSAALGEDTGGSVRGPASCCGVVGLRPTWGRISRFGCVPVSWSMDAAGPLTRTVEDTALLLGVIAGHDAKDPLTSRRAVPDYLHALTDEIRNLRIGVIQELIESEDTDPGVRRAVSEAALLLSRLGAEVSPVSLPLLPRAGAVFMALADSEGAGFHQRWLRERPDEYDAATRRRLLAASLIPAAAHQAAQRARSLIREEILGAFKRHDLLLAPTQPTPAPPIAAASAPVASGPDASRRFFTRRSYSTPASLAGTPALSLPCGVSAEGLPIGLQLMGRPFDEATVLRAAHAYERATDWHNRRPRFD
jgi:aspartyl-tRNA(Asn)/glutamyl-tRNA(Gln) amidotransferase subunit A